MRDEYGRSYAELYRRHWWWRSRERILTRELSRLTLPARSDILDVGCGNGLFFPKLRQFGQVRGIETNTGLLDPENPDRALIHTQPLGDAGYKGWKFDLVTALDVIEHIEDDRLALAEIFSMLRPGGHLVLTVPAFMSLWDLHDEANEHYRRYTKQDLLPLLKPFGTLISARYLFHSIFLPKYLVGALNSKRKQGQKIRQDKVPAAPINACLSQFCYFESRMAEHLNVPFGTSLLAIVRAS